MSTETSSKLPAQELVKSRKFKLAILGSTRGTDMQVIIDSIDSGNLNASIEVVISNQKNAFILQRASSHNLKTTHISSKSKSREVFDRELITEISSYNVDIIVLIGFMKILGDSFTNTFGGKIINVHPSLLPKFAGGMDTNVHEEVIASGEKNSGCTVHLVTSEVDCGKILLQKSCNVDIGEAPESLKSKVQKLEGECLVEVISNWNNILTQIQ